MSRRRAIARCALFLAALGSLAARASAGPGDGAPAPASPAPDVPLAAFDGDPSGEATKADAAAAALLAAGDAAGAAARWMDLVERNPAALLPVPPPVGSPGLWWPAREVAHLRLGGLPPAGALAVESRWGGLAAAQVSEAEAGATEPLERAARDAPTTAAGGRALLALAERDLEEGDGEHAAARFSRWLALRRNATPAERAAVGARLLDARLLAGDELGLSLALRSLLDVAEVPVRRGDETTTIARRAPEAVAELRARDRERAEKPAAGTAPKDRSLATDVLWSMPLGDPKTGAGSWPTPEADVAASGKSLFLCEERRVRRLDLETGFERWRFPAAESLPADFDPKDRYRASERPRRAIVLAGETVLALLGDPPVARESTFFAGGEVVDVVKRGRESRSRLVALDAATGRLRWATGGARETHPVLGAADVGVTSPPLLDGDRVYVTLSARRGAVECWLACLDLATGAPRFVTYLGRAENALRPPADPDARELVSGVVASVPPGQAPARRGDEVCVVPGPGFSAGVGALDGRLRWVAALPRYPVAELPSDDGWTRVFDAQTAVKNAPLAAVACWFVASATSPRVAAIEAGSGRLRWVQASIPPRDAAVPRGLPHLLAARREPDGRVRLLLAGGDGIARVDAATGRAEGSRVGWGRVRKEASVDAGRPSIDGDRVVAWRDDALVSTADDSEPKTPAGGGDDERSLGDVVDLVRVGDVWVLVGSFRLVALAEPAIADRIASATPTDALDAALRLAHRAGRTRTEADFAAAAGAAEKASDPRADAALAVALLKGLLRSSATGDPPGAEVVARVLRHATGLPSALRGPVVHAACGLHLDAKRWEEAASVADDWTRWALDETVGALDETVWSAGSGTVRADLAALAHLRAAALGAAPARPLVALSAREDRAATALAARLADLPRFEGTVAGWDARLSLLARAVDEGRSADAAALSSDLRLSTPVLAPLSAATSQALSTLTAEGLALSGETAAARVALFDAVRAGPGASRTSDGRPAAALSGALEAATAFVARRGVGPSKVDLWSEGKPAPSPAALSATRLLEPTGPGAAPALDLALVARGERVDVRSPSGAAATPVAAPAIGTAGLTLLDREAFVSGEGLPVARIDPGSPAERAGLREGDVVLSIGGAPATDRASVARRIAGLRPGTAVTVEALRRGFPVSVVVEVVERPEGAAGAALPPRAWIPNAGEAIVASAYGLRRVVLLTGESRELWSAPGSAPVAEFAGFAGVLYVATGVAVEQDARLFAVLATTGATLWSAPLPGRATSAPRVLGSAVVIDTTPGTTSILDARTGSLRARRYRATGAFGPNGSGQPAASGSAAGTVALLAWNGNLAFVDPATGEDVEVSLERPFRDPDELASYFLASGGVVSVAVQGREIRTFVPRLVALAPPLGPVVVGESRLFASHPLQGPLNDDARLLVGGDVTYVLRRSPSGPATVAAFEVDRAALEAPKGSDPVVWHPFQRLDPVAATTEERRSGSIVVAANASLDGLWAIATVDGFAGDLSPGRASWFEPLHGDLLVSVATSETVAHAQGPIRVGKNVWIPVDAGFLVLPLVPAEPR